MSNEKTSKNAGQIPRSKSLNGAKYALSSSAKTKKELRRKLDGRSYKDSDSKKAKAKRYWNICCMVLLTVLTVAFLMAYGREYNLSDPVSHGHSIWFILLFSYPLQGVLSLINVALGWSDMPWIHYFTTVNPILGLGIIDAIWLGAIWLVIRWRGLHWMGAYGMRVAGNFLLIFAAWGIFQIFLTGIMVLWNNGGLSPFHAPEKVEVEPVVETVENELEPVFVELPLPDENAATFPEQKALLELPALEELQVEQGLLEEQEQLDK